MTETDKEFKILVVDDEEIVLSLICDTLEDEGYQIQTAGNGEDALKLAEQTEFGLIISDIRMPGMDGIELVKKVKALTPDIGVIFMTGYANLNSAKNAIKQGAFDYIMKPFEISEIRKAVKDAIRLKEEEAAKSSDHQLSSLSDLNQMLDTAGDRNSLAISFLKFTLMHQNSAFGSILFHHADENNFVVLSLVNDATSELNLPEEPLMDLLKETNTAEINKPQIISKLEDHPLYSRRPDDELKPYLVPSWFNQDNQMIIVPVIRGNDFIALIMLGFDEDTLKLKESDIKFLSISAIWLGITLENLTLLKETQQAYARLKELQDETIELEKMATKGEISAEIGHELNNFLGVVVGNLQLLEFNLKKQKYEQLDKYITTMSETMDKITKFTSNLMDVKPISSAEKVIIQFDKMVGEVIDYLRPQKRFRGVDIQVEQLPENIFFEADNTQIMQLLYNLFNNAADATHEKETRTIQVRVDLHEEQQQFIFTIRDNGCGFDPQYLERAFKERFTTKKTGHGFGLVVCNRIIEYHGGNLKVDSVQGEGSTITITFPIAQNVPSEEPVPA